MPHCTYAVNEKHWLSILYAIKHSRGTVWKHWAVMKCHKSYFTFKGNCSANIVWKRLHLQHIDLTCGTIWPRGHCFICTKHFVRQAMSSLRRQLIYGLLLLYHKTQNTTFVKLHITKIDTRGRQSFRNTELPSSPWKHQSFRRFNLHQVFKMGYS